jgi:acetylglutamate kinase
MRIVAKVGGAQLEIEPKRQMLAASVVSAIGAGHEIVLVHGGGNQIRELCRKLGLADRYHEGLRITDGPTADVVLMVLAGLVNKELVHALDRAGARAAGISGADGESFAARRVTRPDADLGYVGEVVDVNPWLVETLLREGCVPVIATSAPLSRFARGAGDGGPSDHFYNINADLAAGPLARALDADALVFLTDVPGVLGADGVRCASLSHRACWDMKKSGVIRGGMIPKVDAALAALEQHPEMLVKIAPADAENCLLAALHDSVGTRFTGVIEEE